MTSRQYRGSHRSLSIDTIVSVADSHSSSTIVPLGRAKRVKLVHELLLDVRKTRVAAGPKRISTNDAHQCAVLRFSAVTRPAVVVFLSGAARIACFQQVLTSAPHTRGSANPLVNAHIIRAAE